MGYVGKITAGGVTGSVASTLFGTCSTDKEVKAKVVTCADFDKLVDGVTINVLFINGYESTGEGQLTMNVNSTGARPIYATMWLAQHNNQMTYMAPDEIPVGISSLTYRATGTSYGYWLFHTGIVDVWDHVKLKGIESEAEVNQNAFSNVKVGSTTIAADAKTDTLELVAGSNVTLTPDGTNDKVTIAATDTTYGDFGGATQQAAGSSGLVPAPASGKANAMLTGDGEWHDMRILAFDASQNHDSTTIMLVAAHNEGTGYEQAASGTINAATTSNSGLMSAADKTKLDGIAAGANAYTHPAYDAATAAAKKVGRDATGHVVLGDALTAADVGASATGHKHAAGDITSGTLGVARGGTGASTLGAGVVYHSASGTEALSIATAANLVSAIGTTAVNRATADANGNDIAATYATKGEIAGLYRYKGSVASEAALPTTGQSTGDVYNIEAASSYGGAGANVAWNGTAWDALGEVFTITALTNAEIDAICV